eukprot:14061814-Alexandrium_andersonii.AAC.1
MRVRLCSTSNCLHASINATHVISGIQNTNVFPAFKPVASGGSRRIFPTPPFGDLCELPQNVQICLDEHPHRRDS